MSTFTALVAPPDTPPTLIVGVHRSGTSALAAALEELGLFLGARQDANAESTFFQRINRRLSTEAGGHWSNPDAVHEAIAGIDDLAAFVEPLRQHLFGPAGIEYWGRQALRRSPLHGPWGWKDPRTAYLLPIWAALFPDLQLIWIRRDPVDSAVSLHRRSTRKRREIDSPAQARSTRSVFSEGSRSVRGRPILADSWRTLHPAQALDVALRYGEMLTSTAASAKHRLFQLNYTDLIDDPVALLQQCTGFLGLSAAPEAIEAAAEPITARPATDLPHEFDAAIEEHAARLHALRSAWGINGDVQ